ncbi:MAG: FAD-dependent monooxygenase [Gammaproteobacteria bacterium]|nr:FAD-dependent monooxygenase [Gammaproteobacteria bacterium]
MKALIVGAGPTGLTAALELCRRGIIPTIIDKRETTSNFSRAVGITPKSLELLSASGVDKKLIAEGIAVKHAHIFRNQQRLIEVPLASENSYFPTLVALPQDRTESLLIEAIEQLGGKVEYGVEFISLEQDRDKVTVQLSSGRKETYDFVIGADGVGSKVRQALDIDYQGFDLDETWSIADVNAADWPYHKDFCLFQLDDGAMCVAVPIGDSRYRVISNTPDSLQALPIPMQVNHINRQGTFKISVRQAKSYSKGRVHLAGDAAHCHSPVGGRGMNMGIGDACELAKRLAIGNIEQYSKVRHQEGQRIIPMTERGRKMISSKSIVRRSLFKGFLRLANRVSVIKKRIGKFVVEF